MQRKSRFNLTFVCSTCGPNAEADRDLKCVRCWEAIGEKKDCVIKRVRISSGKCGNRVTYLPLSDKIKRMV